MSFNYIHLQALNIRVANTFLSRLRGLLFAPPLSAVVTVKGADAVGSQADVRHGLLIIPCNSVHTVGMRYPIDVLFLNPSGEILHITPQLKPWRASMCRAANQTLELAAGQASALGLQVGMHLALDSILKQGHAS